MGWQGTSKHCWLAYSKMLFGYGLLVLLSACLGICQEQTASGGTETVLSTVPFIPPVQVSQQSSILAPGDSATTAPTQADDNPPVQTIPASAFSIISANPVASPLITELHLTTPSATVSLPLIGSDGGITVPASVLSRISKDPVSST